MTQNSAYKLIGAAGPLPTEEIEMAEKPSLHATQAGDLIQFEFKVSGMSCVNCSNNIENKLHGKFDEKEMKSCTIVLLVHKLFTVFPQRVFSSRAVTPQSIAEFVTGIGFACELLGMTEISNQNQTRRCDLQKNDS